MRFFTKRKKSGWFALRALEDGAAIAHVTGNEGTGKPVVRLCEIREEQLKDESGVKSLADHFGLDKRHCALLLNAGEYQLLQVEAPAVQAEEIKQAIRWKLKDMVDYPVEQATLDVLPIPGDPNNPARAQYVYAAAARNEIISDRMERFMGHGLAGLEAIDIPEMAQRNIAARLEDGSRGMAMLSFDDHGGLLTFTAGGELYYARPVEVSLSQLITDDEERQSRIFDRISLDLQRSLDSFERQFPYVGINRLMLAPFPAREAFREFLSAYLGLKVESFNLNDVFSFEGADLPEDLNEQARLFGVLGAALREGAA